jgi:protein TonB
MFEDSTFESTGRIHTRSHNWMIATGAFNGSILLAMILVPLIFPEALPRMAMAFLMEAPKPPVPEPKPMRLEHVNLVQPQMRGGQIFAPRAIPPQIFVEDRQETLPNVNPADMEGDTGTSGSGNNPFSGHRARPVVQQAPKAPAHVSSGVMAGLLIHQVVPAYPALPRAIHLEGTVVLQATISRSGTIENLRVLSGPAMLQQAALDAVQQWHYRPYLLNGQPVEVETTVNVVFKMQ